MTETNVTVLFEEIDRLKKENRQLKNTIGHYYEEHKRIVNEYVTKCNSLKDENEQLKKENKRLKERYPIINEYKVL